MAARRGAFTAPKPPSKPKAKPKRAGIGDNSDDGSDVERKGTFLEYMRLATASLNTLEEARTAHMQVGKRAKAAGLDFKDIMWAIKQRQRDPDEVMDEHNRRVRYAIWAGLPVGTQSEMFGEGSLAGDDHLTDVEREEQFLFDADQAGRKAGRAGHHRGDNPHEAATEPYVAWDRGYLAGQASIAAEMGPNTTMAPKRKKGAPNPEDAPAEDIVH
jgi:hypothetical protein